MEPRPLGDTRIDDCRPYRGIWFDPGEVKALKDEIVPRLRWMDIDLWRDPTDPKVEFNLI